MSTGAGVFSLLPGKFFSPLAQVNREHYAALLVLYYRLFQENSGGLERELVIREFVNYIILHREALDNEENDDETDNDVPGFSPETGFEGKAENRVRAATEPFTDGEGGRQDQERTLANRFLRRLIASGWLGEETLADFTRVINITAWGRPFFEALVRVDEGLKTEYESHVVNVYSALCGETVRENGHFMVLNAHSEARALIDSLKVLSQSIKGYYDSLNVERIRARAASVLHEHYDLYAGEVLDRAYKRLKTSDNVSRYRQAILRQITELLNDEAWLDASAAKYLRILQTSREDCRKKLVFMLEETREDLRAVDPLEDEIDRRNAAYSRASTEIIKAYIEPDSTVAGKLGRLIKAIHGGNNEAARDLAHGIYRVSFLSPSSLSLRRERNDAEFTDAAREADTAALEEAEKEFFERMKRQLSVSRINEWLDGKSASVSEGSPDPEGRLLAPSDLIGDGDSYIRFVYALLYGDSRSGEARENFRYSVLEKEGAEKAGVSAAGFVVPDLYFRRNSKT